MSVLFLPTQIIISKILCQHKHGRKKCCILNHKEIAISSILTYTQVGGGGQGTLDHLLRVQAIIIFSL